MIGRAAALALALFLGASPALADAQSEAQMRDFIAWVDSSPDWSASAAVIRSEGSDTIAEGIVFSRSEPSVSISIEALRLTNLRPRGGGGFSAASIAMSGAGILTEQVNVSVPSGSVANVSMPSFAGISVDPRHMMTAIATFYSTLATGSFGAVGVPEMTVTQRQGLPASAEQVESTVTYRNLAISGLANGVVERQDIGPISISGGAAAQRFAFAIEKVEATRIDLGAWAHVLDPAQYRKGRGDGVWRPIFGRAAYVGVKGNGPEGASFAIAEVAVENVDGRQTDEPFAAVWDRLLDPAEPADVKNDLALEATSAMFAGWRAGTVGVRGIQVHAPKENASFTLDRITLTGWSAAGFDTFILKAMRGTSPEGIVSLGAVEVAGFVAPDLKALVRFAGIDKNAEPAEHERALRETFSALPRVARVAVENLVAGKSPAEAVALDRFSLDMRDWNDIFAGSTSLNLEGLQVPRRLLELDPQTTEIMETLGYDELVFGMSADDRWDPNAGTDEATWTFSMRDAVDVAFSYQLAGLTIDWLMRATAEAAKGEDGKAALMAMLSDIKVVSATLGVTDRSLLDRAFGVAAQKQGLTVDGKAYREQMRAALPFIISAAVPADIAKLVVEPLQKFMAGGQHLVATVAPPTPLGVLDLMAAAGDPLQLPGKLNLTLESQAP